MRAFDFFSPQTLTEAKALLNQYGEAASVLAGGTDLVIEINEGHAKPDMVIDIKKLKELEYVRIDGELIRIGALTSFNMICQSPIIKEQVRVLYDAASKVGSPQIRCLGTIGGNLSTASVAGDGVSAMMTLGASVVLESQHGTRVMPLSEFLDGKGVSNRNALQADEIMTEVFFARPDEYTATAFYKLAKRKSLAISVIGAGMLVQVDQAGICTRASLRGGCLARYPLHFKEAEAHLLGKKITMALLNETLPMLHDAVYESAKSRPWSVFYKKESVQGVYRKLFDSILEQLNGKSYE
ncbi:MAG: FAD binding domain-containing protein [Acetobacterium sp.]|nr:FAD binding domain-containing protein [Acetobacterium sp.]